MSLVTSKQLMCAVFQSEDGADEALEDVQASIEDDDRLIDALSLLCMDEDEVISITESQGEDAYWCGVLAAVVGLVAGPIGAMEDPGEGLLAWLDREAGLTHEFMQEIVASLESGGSIMLGIMDAEIGDLVEEALEETSEDVIWYELAGVLDVAD